MATILEPKFAQEAPAGSDRTFGLWFAAAFTVIGGLPLLHAEQPRWWSFGVAIAIAGAAILRPQVLHPLNRAWLALGRVLHRVMSPLIMGVVYFLCVTPMAWIIRMRGKDLLSLKRRRDLQSYWIPREPSPPTVESMKRQF